MKKRNGFVSNSSSSSFICIMKQEDYYKIYNQLEDFEKKMLDHLEPTFMKKFGIDLVSITGISGNYSLFEDYDLNIDEITNEELREEYEDCGAEWYFDEKIYSKFKDIEKIEDGTSF